MMYGSSTSNGPKVRKRKTAAPTSVAHSHACARTYAKPSARSRRSDPAASRGGGCRVIRATTIADTANVQASTRNATPTSKAAISSPPSAGPAKRSPIGSISSFRALACRSSSRGTTSGTIAVNAGWKSASPRP